MYSIIEGWEVKMDTCKVIQLIETTLTRAGEGKEGDPIRTIKQYWTLDGELVAEYDTWTQQGKCFQ
jgi:hypothetical protein